MQRPRRLRRAEQLAVLRQQYDYVQEERWQMLARSVDVRLQWNRVQEELCQHAHLKKLQTFVAKIMKNIGNGTQLLEMYQSKNIIPLYQVNKSVLA